MNRATVIPSSILWSAVALKLIISSLVILPSESNLGKVLKKYHIILTPFKILYKHYIPEWPQ